MSIVLTFQLVLKTAWAAKDLNSAAAIAISMWHRMEH